MGKLVGGEQKGEFRIDAISADSDRTQKTGRAPGASVVYQLRRARQLARASSSASGPRQSTSIGEALVLSTILKHLRRRAA
jgi:hypothetical protein